MQLGAIFPQTEIGADPAGVRDFAQAAEDLGYEHLLVFDHVLGADASKRESWERPYSSVDTFHDPSSSSDTWALSPRSWSSSPAF